MERGRILLLMMIMLRRRMSRRECRWNIKKEEYV